VVELSRVQPAPPQREVVAHASASVAAAPPAAPVAAPLRGKSQQSQSQRSQSQVEPSEEGQEMDTAMDETEPPFEAAYEHAIGEAPAAEAPTHGAAEGAAEADQLEDSKQALSAELGVAQQNAAEPLLSTAKGDAKATKSVRALLVQHGLSAGGAAAASGIWAEAGGSSDTPPAVVMRPPPPPQSESAKNASLASALLSMAPSEVLALPAGAASVHASLWAAGGGAGAFASGGSVGGSAAVGDASMAEAARSSARARERRTRESVERVRTRVAAAPAAPEAAPVAGFCARGLRVTEAAEAAGHAEEPRIAKQLSRTDEVGRLPKGWLVEVVDGVNVFVNEQSGDRTKERPYDRCGTNGCILLDRHSGMHVFAEFEPSARRARSYPAATAPRPKAAPRVRTSADTDDELDDEESTSIVGGPSPTQLQRDRDGRGVGNGRGRSGKCGGRGRGRGQGGVEPPPSPPPPAPPAASMEHTCSICFEANDQHGDMELVAFGCKCVARFHHRCMRTWYKKTRQSELAQLGLCAAWRWQDKIVACPCCRAFVKVGRPPPAPRLPAPAPKGL
jgi:hypothetical protein